jgi:catechol 2,3-dioxygenase-like lactoylglutathione lyase family enzyme
VRLNHVALAVRDRDSSAAFYGRHFGLTERVHADAHLLILGDGAGSLLALSDSEGPGSMDQPRTTHFGFEVDTAEEVLEARERFAADGVTETEFEGENPYGAPARVQVLDPDGYRVEIYAY